MSLPLPELPGVAHRFVTVGGVRLHVAEAGSGPPILLQHGWPQNWWEWRRLIGPLAADHRVICPDLRGLGWSDAPRGRYDKETLAGDLLGVLDALELALPGSGERVRLVGHDWGGFVGFLACLRAPERFESFLALSITHPWFGVGSGVPDPRALLRLWYQFVIGVARRAAAVRPPGADAPRGGQRRRRGVRRADGRRCTPMCWAGRTPLVPRSRCTGPS